MDKSSLGDRMKEYEDAYNFKFPIRLPLILRLDGVHFHSQVNKWGCDKPFDARMISAMENTVKYLCENISGAQVAYSQSDEITILVRDDMTHDTQPWHKKKINKIMSVAAAKASNAFNHSYFNLGDPNTQTNIPLSHMAEFDCRGYVMPENEIINAFIWRQQDATRNSIQMMARANFSHNSLENVNCEEIQERLWQEKNINWNDTPTNLKRGFCVIKQDIEKSIPKRDGKSHKIIPNEFVNRTSSVWVVDRDIPIFTKDRGYINKFTYCCEKGK